MSHKNLKVEGMILLILESINDIKNYTHDVSKVQFLTDRMMVDACVMKFQVIGEIINSLSKKYPEIDLGVHQKMIDLRNIISHDYFGINKEEIRALIQYRIQNLESYLQELLKIYDR